MMTRTLSRSITSYFVFVGLTDIVTYPQALQRNCVNSGTTVISVLIEKVSTHYTNTVCHGFSVLYFCMLYNRSAHITTYTYAKLLHHNSTIDLALIYFVSQCLIHLVFLKLLNTFTVVHEVILCLFQSEFK